MVTNPNCFPAVPVTPFAFSILVSSPIHHNIPFSPVSAMIFPLAKVQLPFAGLIVAGLDILMTFLEKRLIVQAPDPKRPPPEMFPVTLNLAQLSELIQNAARGQIIFPNNKNNSAQSFGPVGGDEPLFPDNLSFSLIVGAPFGRFDGSPDSSFNVPLFEVPGAPGNLILAAAMLISQFLIERSGNGGPGYQSNAATKGGGS
jgi:hypothetical protein